MTGAKAGKCTLQCMDAGEEWRQVHRKGVGGSKLYTCLYCQRANDYNRVEGIDGVMCLYVELSHWHMRINAVKTFIIQYFPLIYAFI